jgi:predicted enzyme related to lactoylglutathione lyase
VYLELHTGDLGPARDFYAGLLGWHPDRVVTTAGTYLTMTAHGELALWQPKREGERTA